MAQQTEAPLSRRNAIFAGLGTAATAAVGAVAASAGQNHGTVMLVNGFVSGQPGAFLINAGSGRVSRTASRQSPCESMTASPIRLSDGKQYLHQSCNGDVLVCDEQQTGLSILSSSGQLKYKVPTDGVVADAEFSADGREIAFVESDIRALRLIVMQSNGYGRRVLSITDEFGGMRGVSWSPCGRYIAVVAYDWEQVGESSGCPVPNSHRIELFSAVIGGAHRSVPVTGAAWLDRPDWIVG